MSNQNSSATQKIKKSIKKYDRRWKKVKTGLYITAVVAAMSAGALIPEAFENLDQNVSVVHADPTATSKITVYVAASAVPSGHAVYAWAWNSSYGGGEAIELTLNSAGTEYVGTLGNDASSSLGFLLVQSDDTSANGVTSWPDGWNDSASSKLANSAQWGSSGTALPSGNSFLYVDSSSYKIVSKPSITAPNELTEGTADDSYDLTAVAPTISDSNNLGNGTVSSYTITGPSGSKFQSTNATDSSFTPDVPGLYTITYNYDYTNPDETTGNVSDSVTLQVASQNPNTITTVNPGPDITELTATDLSATAQKVVDQANGDNATEVPTIQSVKFTAANSSTEQTITADSAGKYTFPTAGTYTVKYTDSTGAIGKMTGKVVAQPATFATVASAKTTAVVGSGFDTADLETLTDPNDSSASISNATVKVTGPTDSQFAAGITLDSGTTSFTPDVAGTYTIDYSYVDGTGTTQTATQMITADPQPTLNTDASFTADLTVTADDNGTSNYDPTAQGVFVDDERNSDAQPDVTVTPDDGDGTALTANADGTYNLTAGESYTVEWSYDSADPSTIDQYVTVKSANQDTPTVTAPLTATTAPDESYDLLNDVTIKDSTGETVDTTTTLQDYDLTLSVFDPTGNFVDVNDDGTFTPTMNGYYTATYDYTDPTTGAYADKASSTILVEPTVTAPADQTTTLSGTQKTYTFNPAKVTVDDPLATDSTADNYDYGDPDSVVAIVTDAAGNTLTVNSAGSYDLAVGKYLVAYTYTWYDPNEGGIAVEDTATQTITVAPAPTLSAGKDVTTTLTGKITSYNFKPDVSASDDSAVTVAIKNVKTNETVTAAKDGSYDLTAGTYQVTYTDDTTSNNPVTETVTVNPAPTLVPSSNVTVNLAAGQQTYEFVPSVSASDDSTVVVSVVNTATGTAVKAASDGSYNLVAGTYQVIYTDDTASNSPLTETLMVKAVTKANGGSGANSSNENGSSNGQTNNNGSNGSSNQINGNGDSNKSNNKDHQGNNLTAVNSSTVTPKAAITEKQSKKIVTATTGESTLPQTDQQTSSTWSAVLGVLLMLAGFFGFSVDSQKRKHD
jgi:LPXTG-motif cell wall-anchored protein